MSEGLDLGHRLLSAVEEKPLAKRVERGDLAAKEQLIQANLRLVVSIARRYRGAGRPRPRRARPGGRPRADPRCREVRLAQGLPLLDLRDAVDPPVDPAGSHRPRARDPPAGGRGPARAQARRRSSGRCSHASGATLRPTSWPRAAEMPPGDGPAPERRRPGRWRASTGSSTTQGGTELGDLLASGEPSPAELVEARDRAETVRRTVESLPPPARAPGPALRLRRRRRVAAADADRPAARPVAVGGPQDRARGAGQLAADSRLAAFSTPPEGPPSDIRRRAA